MLCQMLGCGAGEGERSGAEPGRQVFRTRRARGHVPPPDPRRWGLGSQGEY